jgi:hypothetical protein
MYFTLYDCFLFIFVVYVAPIKLQRMLSINRVQYVWIESAKTMHERTNNWCKLPLQSSQWHSTRGIGYNPCPWIGVEHRQIRELVKQLLPGDLGTIVCRNTANY